jgi:hypothetical protein
MNTNGKLYNTNGELSNTNGKISNIATFDLPYLKGHSHRFSRIFLFF